MSSASLPVRTRFAPSPTGFLHLGGARTALFAWAFARRHEGQFILRIEDTDVERSTPEAIQAILDGMAWLELDYDEGPYHQMQRMDRYREVLAQMLAQGHAYHCYMSVQELDALRAEQVADGEKPRYDGRWRPENLKQGQRPPPGIAPVIRFKNPLSGSVAWDDQVKGRIEIANAELDDLIIARSDETPTYNFCVVVDDLDMKITHVIRGDDHVNNTPRQINMIRALGAEPPVYGHLPTVLGSDGTKLSKRHGAVSVMHYADEGFLPEAMVNFLARLGWAHGDDEIFTREQLVSWFDIAHVNPAPARFDADKLLWVNHEHIKRLTDEALAERLRPFLERAGLEISRGPPLASVAALVRDRVATLAEMRDEVHYFYEPPQNASQIPEKFAKVMTDGVRAALPDLLEEFERIDWTREAIGAAIKSVAARKGLKPPQIMMAVRPLVTGVPQSPPIDAVLALLGRETVRARIKSGLALS
ncbi:MAG: glutamate--tRNA ligase [Betaproteobacteria bacterium]|nr:MAG: glutamate--tRNA ligase [Betaproteobacteria bacterium]